MVFGRKKKEEEAVETKIVNGTISNNPVPEPPKELKREYTLEELELIKKIEELDKTYTGFMGAGDVASLPESALRATELTLLFAIYAETKKLNETLLRIEKLEE